MDNPRRQRPHRLPLKSWHEGRREERLDSATNSKTVTAVEHVRLRIMERGGEPHAPSRETLCTWFSWVSYMLFETPSPHSDAAAIFLHQRKLNEYESSLPAFGGCPRWTLWGGSSISQHKSSCITNTYAYWLSWGFCDSHSVATR